MVLFECDVDKLVAKYGRVDLTDVAASLTRTFGNVDFSNFPVIAKDVLQGRIRSKSVWNQADIDAWLEEKVADGSERAIAIAIPEDLVPAATAKAAFALQGKTNI